MRLCTTIAGNQPAACRSADLCISVWSSALQVQKRRNAEEQQAVQRWDRAACLIASTSLTPYLLVLLSQHGRLIPTPQNSLPRSPKRSGVPCMIPFNRQVFTSGTAYIQQTPIFLFRFSPISPLEPRSQPRRFSRTKFARIAMLDAMPAGPVLWPSQARGGDILCILCFGILIEEG